MLQRDRAQFLKNLTDRAARIKDVDGSWWNYKLSENEIDDFDVLKLRRRCLREIDYVSTFLKELGRHKVAGVLQNEKKKYETIDPENMIDVLNGTLAALKKEEKEACVAFKRGMDKVIYKNYQLDEQDLEKVQDRYLKYLDDTKKDLEDLSKYKLSEEIEKRREEALEYIDHCQERMKKKSRGGGRSREMSR